MKLTTVFLSFLQADFPTSAVDFLHRVGRTARAGHSGLVTSLYSEENHDLVAAVRGAENIGDPVVYTNLPHENLSPLPNICAVSFPNSDEI